jgi:CcmD family protein
MTAVSVRRLSGWFMAVLAIAACCAPLAAQAQEGFTPIKPGDIQESLPATPFVFVAYAFAWAAVAFYVFWMWRRLARVEKELAEVRGRLQGPSR